MKTHRHHERIKSKYWFLSFFYDLLEIFFSFNPKTNPRHGLARLIPNDELQVLDVCFGTGNSTLLVAKNNHRNMITGVDLSADMLKVANRKIRKQGLSNVETVWMDAAKMDLEDESFDVATSSFGLHEMEYPVMESIMKECGFHIDKIEPYKISQIVCATRL